MSVTERSPLDPKRLAPPLPEPWRELRVMDAAASTNDVAAGLAREGEPEGLVVVAEHQRAGRGRLDRSFELAPRSALPVSFVLRPGSIPLPRWPWLIFVSALAVCDVAESYGVPSQVKWPNDVLIDGKKVSGINMEHVATASCSAAVVGIGLNVLQTDDELPVESATSLSLALGGAPDRTEVLRRMLAAFGPRYVRWRDSGGDARGVRADYEARCSSIGSVVRIHLPGGKTVEGLATEIDVHGRIVVGGRAYSAGDVVHLRRR